MELLVTGVELLWTGLRELSGAEVSCRDGVVVAVSNRSGLAETFCPSPQGSSPAPARSPKQPEELAEATAVAHHPSASAPSEPTQRLDASGCVVIPGLVNAHHHLMQSAFRTLPGTCHVRMASWLSTMAGYYQLAAVDPPLVAAAAAVALAEGLLAGVTTVADHHLTWPEECDALELASSVVSVAASMRSRLVFVRGSAGGDPQEAACSVADLVDRFGILSPDGMLQIACGPAGVHSDGREMFDALGEVAAEHGLRRRTQANEQVDVERALARWGQRPLALLEDWGWLAPDVTLAHLCEITPEEVSRVAASGTSATHAPGCDVPMGWGVAPVGELLDAGVTLGLGTSGGGSNDAGQLLADARLALQVGGLSSRPPTAREVLEMATSGSAKALGRPELGHLEPGAAADFCCYDITGPADAGVADPLAGLLWANPSRRPRHVVVAGEVVVRDGELLTADASRLSAELRCMARERLGGR